MSNNKNLLIAERYAQSLINIGKDNKLSFMTISADLANIHTILTKSPDLYKALVNPLVSVENKLEIIDSVFSKDIDLMIKDFLKILIEADRFTHINEIISIYNNLLDEENGVLRFEVISAIELNENEKNRIYDKLTEKTEKQVSIKYSVDESLIAGFILKKGDDVFDMSISRKIENLKKAVLK